MAVVTTHSVPAVIHRRTRILPLKFFDHPKHRKGGGSRLPPFLSVTTLAELLHPGGERVAQQTGIDFRLSIENRAGYVAASFRRSGLLAVVAGDSADRVMRT